jgi:DNA-nicking Smr family endonuclease
MSDHDDNHPEDDRDLFSQAMADVRPISQQPRVSLRRKPARIKKRPQAEAQIINDTLSDDFIPPCGEQLEFMRPGVQKSLLKQMRNGKLPVEDRIDLHGLYRDQARTQLLQFIQQAQLNGYKIVCVVHGKGYHSADGRPVLKAMVNKWLQNIADVLAFTSAPHRDGGYGAVYVLIRRLPPGD